MSRSRGLVQAHHNGHLILSDSETTFCKFRSMKIGSYGMDAVRDAWLDLQTDMPFAAALDHVPRYVHMTMSDFIYKSQVHTNKLGTDSRPGKGRRGPRR